MPWIAPIGDFRGDAKAEQQQDSRDYGACLRDGLERVRIGSGRPRSQAGEPDGETQQEAAPRWGRESGRIGGRGLAVAAAGARNGLRSRGSLRRRAEA